MSGPRGFHLVVSSSSLQYMRSLNNFRAEQPHQHAMYYLRLLMTEVAWTKDELREALDGETPLFITLSLSFFLCVCLKVPVLVPVRPFSTVGQTEFAEIQNKDSGFRLWNKSIFGCVTGCLSEVVSRCSACLTLGQ